MATIKKEMSREEELIVAAHNCIVPMTCTKEGSMDCFLQGAKYADRTMLDNVCEWLKKNVTYTHPRKGTKECIVNLNALKEAMKRV